LQSAICAPAKCSTAKAATGVGQTDACIRNARRRRTADRTCHRVKLKSNVAHGTVVRWSDVEVDENSDTIKTAGDGSRILCKTMIARRASETGLQREISSPCTADSN
jgi:hypothetical protein